MEIPNYIFQVKKDQLAKMLAAGNMRAGKGVIIEMKDDAIEIRLDPTVIAEYIWCFVKSNVLSSVSARYNWPNTLQHLDMNVASH